MKLVFLELSSLVGMSLGAVHTYGVLKPDDSEYDHNKEVQIERFLTATEAEEINTNSPASAFREAKEGDKVPGFPDAESVIKRGIELFKELWSDTDAVLILGSSSVAEPQPALTGPPEIAGMMNYWAAMVVWYRIENNEIGMDIICNRYWNWLHPK